jgi:hypothetical protein
VGNGKWENVGAPSGAQDVTERYLAFSISCAPEGAPTKILGGSSSLHVTGESNQNGNNYGTDVQWPRRLFWCMSITLYLLVRLQAHATRKIL